MNLHKLLLTQNACYLAGQTIVPKGIMVHSTGCNNPWLRRYVGPDDGLLGVNGNSNHWNTYHPDGRAVCVHGFIGKLADGTIATYQTLPWNYRGWHAGGAANNTFDGKGELLITIMSSLAQEESRSISENITWGQRKSFSDGKVHLPYKRFLGYEKGENGRPAVVEEEAAVVRLIYRLFLEGKTQAGICKYLEDLGIPSPGGKQKWSKTTVTSILQNEKYKGDALLQKKFTVDFLEKKMKPNEGEVPQYYVEGSHPAIIEPDEWEQVQAEFTRRKDLGKAYSGKSVLSAKLVCEDCGGFFGSKVWH